MIKKTTLTVLKMKKTIFSVLMAAALGFMACSEDDTSVYDNRAEGDSPKGMVLRATVEQPAASRATISDAWLFDFATGDKVSVTNTEVTAGTYYTFTNDGKEFKSADAVPTASAATWYAYFPSSTIDLTGQSGTKADVANTYALAGTTTEATTGEGGLEIELSPQVAILVIDNQKGTININVKNSASTWVSGLTASAAGFTVTDATEKQTLLSATKVGSYYVAVPAGVQLAVKDGDMVIKSTKAEGLAAGSYYNLTIEPFGQGMAKATIGSGEVDVKWVQLWEGGPKFAEYNVGVTDGNAESFGGYYNWGGTYKNGETIAWRDDHKTGSNDLTGKDDTATALWGSNWRMPTSAEYEALLEHCEMELIKGYEYDKYELTNPIRGARFKGKTGTVYESNSLFLPAGANCAEKMPPSEFLIDGLTEYQYGVYWSSTADGSEKAHFLFFGTSEDGEPVKGLQSIERNVGFSVRAVLK